LGQLLTLSTSIITARLLGAAVFGEYGMVLSTIATFGTVAGLGLGTTATKYVAELRSSDPIRAGKIAALCLTLSLLSSGTIALVLYVLAPHIAATLLGASRLIPELRFGCALLVLNAVAGAQSGVLSGIESFRRVAAATVIRGLITFPAVCFGAWGWGLLGALAGLVLASAGSVLITHLLMNRDCRVAGITVSLGWRVPEWGMLWRFSLPTVLSNILVVPATWATNILLVREPGGYEQLGIYNVAGQWRMALLFLPSVFASVALPAMTRLHAAGNMQGYRRLVLIVAAFSVAAAAIPAFVVCLCASRIAAICGAGFEQTPAVVMALSAVAVLTAVNNIVGAAITATGRAWAGAAFNLLWAACFVGAAIILIPLYLATGLAWALAGAYISHTLWQFAYVRFILLRPSCPSPARPRMGSY
jgi:O-antigen/teichoic acid export membrane protein